MATVLPLRTAWKADILSQASLRDVQRQRFWKRGSGDGRDFGTTVIHFYFGADLISVISVQAIFTESKSLPKF